MLLRDRLNNPSLVCYSYERAVSKVVPVWEFPKMTSREFPGISRFFGKTRAGNGKKHIEIFAPKLQRHF